LPSAAKPVALGTALFHNDREGNDMMTKASRMASVMLAMACVLSQSAALADKPEWAASKGKGHRDREDQDRRAERGDQERRAQSGERHFEDRHRVAVREYYGHEFESGHCPPGLAKKRDGCLPPGQARKWAVGHPLPRDVVRYDVPAPLVVQLGTPPAGYKYVRVAGDVLMIAIGTSMVVDAIKDLGR